MKLVAAALAACVGAGPAAAAGLPILLPSVRTSLTPGPPLAGRSAPATEVVFPPGMTSDQRVLVGIDTTGKPVSVAVVQRLTLRNLGDYSFAVSGPIVDVEAAPGTDSEPGLRRDAILWSGFSPGKKTLAARATLRFAAASAVLPLRVTIEREGDALILRGANVTAAPGPVLLGDVSPQEAARALDATRQRLPLGRSAPDLYLNVPRTPLSRSEPIAAPLDVRGEFAGKRFAYTLGDGRPLFFELRVPHAAANAKLQLVVTPVPPRRLLTPPGAKTWAEALRRGSVPRARLLERISRLRLTEARELQYRTFLVNPNAAGRSSAVYVYGTAKKTAAPPTSAAPSGGGDNAWSALLIAALAVLGSGALVVLWAHS